MRAILYNWARLPVATPEARRLLLEQAAQLQEEFKSAQKCSMAQAKR